MIVLIGASASGKTELAKILFNQFGYHKCVTTTTREPRQGERNHIDYHFITKEDFSLLENSHAFLEVTTYQKQRYGIQKKDVDVQGVVIVDPDGANSLSQQLKDNVFIIYVDANQNLRHMRMLNRGDSKRLITERLKSDQTIFDLNQLNRVDLIIKNELDSIEDLAHLVHMSYQKYMNRIKK